MARLLILLAVALPVLAQQKPTDNPAVARAKALAAFTPKFERYVFDGERFPTLEPAPDLNLSVAFYDRDYQQVLKAERPGPYVAVVQVRPAGVTPTKRYVTLFRGPAPTSAAHQPTLEALAKDDPDGKKPATARQLAGIRLSPAFVNPVKKSQDPLAFERQWVLGLKAKLNGWDKQFPGDLALPVKLHVVVSPVVREGTPEEAGVKPDTGAKIDEVLTKWAADTDQAFAVCVVRNGVIVHHKAYGTRDGRPMTTETKSWMASVTKTMSATLLMMLVDAGLVGLDDDVSKYFPVLKGIEVKKPLRVRNLLNHTGGLADFPMHDDTMPDVEERLAHVYPHLKVGEKWAYGGTGNVLAGKIVEAVTGQAVPVAYHRYLLEPLGMNHTDVTGTHADAYSVPLDMAKFGQVLLNKGSYGSLRFLRPETFELMLPRKLTEELGPAATKTFGLGLDGSPTKFGHGAASAATFSIDAENQLVIVMTRNKQGKNDAKYNALFHEAIKAGLGK
jgi:CubicO group peptidase (beta-lactamase class C family)